MLNPEIGVTKTQVTIPLNDEYTVLTVTPLLLLIETIDCSIAPSPFGDSIILTSTIDVPFRDACNIPVVT